MNSPILALLAIVGPNAAYTTSSACSNAVSREKVLEELKEPEIPCQVGSAEASKHPQGRLEQ